MATCTSCGNELGKSVAFCPYCGQPLTPAQAQPTYAQPLNQQPLASASHLKRNVAIVAVTAAIAVATFVLLLGGSPFNHTQTVVVASGAAVVPPSFYLYDDFTVPAGATSPVLSGTVTPRGNLNDQITVIVMSQSDFQTWLNGVPVNLDYNSGPVQSASVDVPLVAGQSYTLVFVNTISYSGMAIYGTITLTYSS